MNKGDRQTDALGGGCGSQDKIANVILEHIFLVSAIAERTPYKALCPYVCMSVCPKFLTVTDFNDDVMLASALCKDDISLM